MNKELLDYFLSFMKPHRIARMLNGGFVLLEDNDNDLTMNKRIEMCEQAVKDGYLTRKETLKDGRWYCFTEDSKNILRALVLL